MVSLFFPKLGFKKCPPVRIGNTGNTSRCFKSTSHQNTNSQLSGNLRFYNQKKKDNSTSNSRQTNKKNSRSRSNQSNWPNIKQLIVGLKALLKQFI
ncbi:hypothetical protein RclHR1_10420004 [Rhizophagus clarus]|uniref:Uncharacterized protein n=1 Tax=Rhizophagus clarus TaxID=94130 RepID=A0A2Z6Q643_9GLOM|nr:hypothetical protein RclHR1_10420004 [Rhizophagus clarus]GES80420.1 hypothetical protein RCL_e3939_RclHR1_10420004 [Rhizophagus clarus]